MENDRLTFEWGKTVSLGIELKMKSFILELNQFNWCTHANDFLSATDWFVGWTGLNGLGYIHYRMSHAKTKGIKLAEMYDGIG